MQRRHFFKWLASGGAFAALPAWLSAWAQGGSLKFSAEQRRDLAGLAAVVLPASLGRAGSDRIAADFAAWCEGYREDADLGYGYGHPRTRRSGPNPARGYARQLAALGAAPTREQVETAMRAAGVTTMPRRPQGKHVAADLLGHFYFGSAGTDYLYQAAILSGECRGFTHNSERPHAS